MMSLFLCLCFWLTIMTLSDCPLNCNDGVWRWEKDEHSVLNLHHSDRELETATVLCYQSAGARALAIITNKQIEKQSGEISK